MQVSGEINPAKLKRLAHGQMFNGIGLPGCKASQQNEEHIRIVIKNPLPQVLTRLCASIDLEVLAMRRIRIGAVSMGKLPLGQWRYCTPTQKF